ncbi:mite allergen Der f 3-like [Galleria mellonella]|uniref:Mite allergen Der f 3-like n=1 Tax=Galleria mellonella TaxID=7137 RepID=A0ABM3N1W3_GALME|nr:mite allergen Der f 3-like [Galleria mellonella]
MHSHPYMVSLQLNFWFLRTHICGGSLISDNWIITASHCITGSWLIDWLNIDAVAGTHDVDFHEPGTQIIRIVQRTPHPDYAGGVGPHDIGLLKTQYSFTLSKQIQPIRLPETFNVNDKIALAGWGVYTTILFLPILPNKLQEVIMEYLPYEECYNALEKIIEETGESNALVKNSNLCTGPISGGVAACSGDSGGPLVQYVTKITKNNNSLELFDKNVNNLDYEDFRNYRNLNEETYYPVLIGITSWGISPCGEAGAPTVYTNVSNYIGFINNITQLSTT